MGPTDGDHHLLALRAATLPPLRLLARRALTAQAARRTSSYRNPAARLSTAGSWTGSAHGTVLELGPVRCTPPGGIGGGRRTPLLRLRPAVLAAEHMGGGAGGFGLAISRAMAASGPQPAGTAGQRPTRAAAAAAEALPPDSSNVEAAEPEEALSFAVFAVQVGRLCVGPVAAQARLLWAALCGCAVVDAAAVRHVHGSRFGEQKGQELPAAAVGQAIADCVCSTVAGFTPDDAAELGKRLEGALIAAAVAVAAEPVTRVAPPEEATPGESMVAEPGFLRWLQCPGDHRCRCTPPCADRLTGFVGPLISAWAAGLLVDAYRLNGAAAEVAARHRTPTEAARAATFQRQQAQLQVAPAWPSAVAVCPTAPSLVFQPDQMLLTPGLRWLLGGRIALGGGGGSGSLRSGATWTLLTAFDGGVPVGTAAATVTGGSPLSRLAAVAIAAAPGLPLVFALQPATTGGSDGGGGGDGSRPAVIGGFVAAGLTVASSASGFGGGSEESFLWVAESAADGEHGHAVPVQVWAPTGRDRNFVFMQTALAGQPTGEMRGKGRNPEGFGLGGMLTGAGLPFFGLHLGPCLSRGSSRPTVTYNNPPLHLGGAAGARGLSAADDPNEFRIGRLEVWALSTAPTQSLTATRSFSPPRPGRDPPSAAKDRPAPPPASAPALPAGLLGGRETVLAQEEAAELRAIEATGGSGGSEFEIDLSSSDLFRATLLRMDRELADDTAIYADL
eukprot:SAG22_NODE_554_length_9135_cov_3.635569_10_plen_730_part_00